MSLYSTRLKPGNISIFLFHGVVAESKYEVRNYTRKHLPLNDFRDILADLKGHGTALSMDDIEQIISSGEPFPDQAFAITFDDGFENNYSVAAPALSDFGIPGMFYVTSGFIEKNSMSWIDRIEFAFENTASASFSFPWGNEVSFDNAARKRAILDDIRWHVKRDESIDQDEFVAWIYRQIGMDEVLDTDDPLDLKMSWKQVEEMHHSDLFTIGGHTHTHPIMSHLSPADLDFEIDHNLSLLKEKGNVDTHHFSYPEGLEHCYNQQVIDALKMRGIKICPSAIDGDNYRGSDPFHLKRIPVV